MAATTIPSPTSGSDVIQALFIAESERIGYSLWSYQANASIWGNALPRGKFQLGMGARQRTVNMEISRVGTNGRMTWADHGHLGFSSAATGNSPPDISETRGNFPTTTIQGSQTVKDFGLRKAAVESPRIDILEAMLDWNYSQQFDQYFEQLQSAASSAWDAEQRESYFALCDNKVIIGIPESGTPLTTMADLNVVAPNAFITDNAQGKRGLTGYTLAQLNATGNAPSNGVSASHSTLNQGTLQVIRSILDRVRTGDSRIVSPESGNNVYPIICSPQQKFWAEREAGTRGDLRYGKPGNLLKKFGNEELHGFQYLCDPEVPRFTLALNGSTYDFTEVLPWSYQAGNISTAIASAATSGGGYTTTLTVTTSVGFVAGNRVTITPSSASDEEYAGNFTVLAVPSSTTIIIDKAFTDTMTGTIYTNNNGQSRWVRNPSYDVAPYEMSIILLPDVMELLTVDFPKSIGRSAEFADVSPLGTFDWKNIRDEDRNPDGFRGYYRGLFMYGARPKATSRGWAIMHRVATPEVLSAPSLTGLSGMGWWQ